MVVACPVPIKSLCSGHLLTGGASVLRKGCLWGQPGPCCQGPCEEECGSAQHSEHVLLLPSPEVGVQGTAGEHPEVGLPPDGVVEGAEWGMGPYEGRAGVGVGLSPVHGQPRRLWAMQVLLGLEPAVWLNFLGPVLTFSISATGRRLSLAQ